MRKLFDLENPVFQLISHLVDLVVLGIMQSVPALRRQVLAKQTAE